MSEVPRLLERIFSAYERSNSATGMQTHQTDSDGKTTLVCTESGRGDMVLAEHVADNAFVAIRIEGVSENESQRARRVATKPTAAPSKQFKHCKYQLLTFESSDVRNGGGSMAVHRACHWNSNATRLRTAESARQIVRDWKQHRNEISERLG